MKKIKKKFSKEEKMMFGVIIILGVILLGLFYYVYVKPAEATKGPKQIKVEIIEITTDCEDCFDLSTLTNQMITETDVLLKSNKSFDYNSKEGREAIKKYNIKNVPALIIKSKRITDIPLSADLFVVGKDFATFDKAVPSINLQTGETNGLVHLKEIQPTDCIDCTSPSNLRSSFESLGIKIKDYEFIPASSDAGKQIIKNNGLTFAPALLVSKDIDDYWWAIDQIKPTLQDVGEYYLFNVPLTPYKEISTGGIKGIVNAIYLENSSCSDCFNATALGNSFRGAGVYLKEEKVIDISSNEGKSLLNKYNIIAIPTIILSKEITDYVQLKQTLTQVGTFESDGFFVFRKLDSTNAKYQEIKS